MARNKQDEMAAKQLEVFQHIWCVRYHTFSEFKMNCDECIFEKDPNDHTNGCLIKEFIQKHY